MTSFMVTEEHLRRLSPASRRELLQVIGEDFERSRSEFEGLGWDPEGDESYPLSVDEVRVLVHGMPEPGLEALRRFAANAKGQADFHELLEATGYKSYEQLAQEFAWILLRVRTVTANPDAWLFNWHSEDWVWDDDQHTFSKGTYFISGPATDALKEVLLEG